MGMRPRLICMAAQPARARPKRQSVFVRSRNIKRRLIIFLFANDKHFETIGCVARADWISRGIPCSFPAHRKNSLRAREITTKPLNKFLARVAQSFYICSRAGGAAEPIVGLLNRGVSVAG